MKLMRWIAYALTVAAVLFSHPSSPHIINPPGCAAFCASAPSYLLLHSGGHLALHSGGALLLHQ